MASTTDFIVAIELGSSKIAGIAGRKNSDGSIDILARAKEDSSAFIRKGTIFNLDKTVQSLKSIISKLEPSLEGSISKVYVGIGGQSLHTVKNTVVRDLKEDTVISQVLIDAICDENRGMAPEDLEILDVAPQEYKVGNTLQAEPVGVSASHIEGHFMNIVARTSIRKNLERCFEKANIKIADEMFLSPLVTAKAVLTPKEMHSGCALVDIGADTTTVSVYKDDILRFLSVIPLGGNNITRDIASLDMEEQEAEKLKLKYGNALFDHETEAETPEPISLEDSQITVDPRDLNDVIEARAEEIAANIAHQLSDYVNGLRSGIVITGGGSNLKNMAELIRRKTGTKNIRVASAPHYDVKSQDYTDLEDGTQNTLFGLLAAGTENCCRRVEQPTSGGLFDDEVKPNEPVKPSPKSPKGPDKGAGKGWFQKIKEGFTDELFTDEEK
jgi:cell division protein FtsA